MPATAGTAFITPSILKWGTQPYVNGTFVTTCIVKSIKANPRVEEIKVENNGGFTGAEVLLYDGDDCEITVLDNTGVPNSPIAAPPIGSNVQLLLATGTNGLMMVIDNSVAGARKEPGEWTVKAKSFATITLS